ncbi:META domain-containing protein [Paracoccus sediminis]|uniref:Heat shock protein HslJ n=1 Tax=Paracoccus sediminis TaxID=1214787 RepID=A0A238W251_9RHOB|nr:META domain-containing protein [Paracoccus sediminis]TBN51512.1 META domain-containing protein [Paracoccus sediminis]SNR40675.1 Heat shock protein HslJ [Paracoccus sediminis]
MPATRILAALATATALTACQDAGERSVALLRPGDSFAVTRIDGNPAPQGGTFQVGGDGRVSGAAPCNRFSARLAEQGGAMTLNGVVMTRRACLDPARTMAETRFAIALTSVTGARARSGQVSLIDAEGRERIGLAPVGGT